jgi:hypothetical protein
LTNQIIRNLLLAFQFVLLSETALFGVLSILWVNKNGIDSTSILCLIILLAILWAMFSVSNLLQNNPLGIPNETEG